MPAARERVASQNTKKAHPTAAQDSILLKLLDTHIRSKWDDGLQLGGRSGGDEAFVKSRDETENKAFHVGEWHMAYGLSQMAFIANGYGCLSHIAISSLSAIGYLPSAIRYLPSAICYPPSAILHQTI